MDPVTVLGITASIIACIQLSGSALKQLGPSSNSRDDLNKILKTLCGFKGAFDGIKVLVEVNNDDHDRLSTLQHINEPLKACQEALELIQQRLQHTNFLGKYVVGKIWDGRLRKALNSLDDAKDLLELCMCADQGAILSAVQHYVRSIANDVQELKGLLNDNGKRILDITDEIQNMATQTQRNHDSLDSSLGYLGCSVSQAQTESAAKKRHLEIEKSLARFGQNVKEQKNTKVLKWLFHSDPNINHNAACTKRGKDTGTWLFSNEWFLKWRDEMPSVIWLSGMAGCGKTFLSSAIIDHIGKHSSCAATRSVVAFYYFSFSDPAKRSVGNFVSSLLLQIVQPQASIPASLRSLHDEYQLGQPPLPRLLQCLRSAMADSGHVFVILDALDECPTQDGERDLLLSTLSQMRGWNLAGLRLLLTSRVVDDISHHLTVKLSAQPLRIDNEVVSADIRTYVRAELSSLFADRQWPSELQPEIEDVLVRGANGVFRWVSCQLDLIKASRSPGDVRRELKLLPRTLDETYERALVSMMEQNCHEEAAAGLAWLVFSARTIRVEEFTEAAALAAHGVPDPKRLEKSALLLKSLEAVTSSSRREIGEGDFDYTRQRCGQEVQDIKLAHFSVQEYLTSERISQGPARSFRIERGKAHALIAEMCLKYLMRFDEEGSISRDTIPKYFLLKYAARWWHVHLLEAADDRQRDLARLAAAFLRSPGGLKNWLYINCGRARDLSAPLFYACMWGLVETVRTLLVADRAQINSPLHNMRSCLPIAARSGFNDVVQLLIDCGADLRNRDSRGNTALHEAVTEGHISTIRLLLASGARTDSDRIWGQTALHDAARMGFVEICDILITHGPSSLLHRRDNFGKTALHHACRSRSGVSVVSCLLDHGADISTADEDGHLPLHEACLSHSTSTGAIIELLIARGAKYDLQSGLGWTPFMLAVENENPEAIKQLLQYGRPTLFPEDRPIGSPDAGDQDCWPDTLLGVIDRVTLKRIYVGFDHYGEEQDAMDEAVQLLLESGYGKPEDHGAILLLCAEWSWVSTSNYLLEGANTDPFHQTDSGETALHLAIKTYSRNFMFMGAHDLESIPFRRRQAQICTDLLRVGGGKLADTPDKKGYVPFEMAFKLGWTQALTPMIKYGANYHQFGPPLHDTSWSWGYWGVLMATSPHNISDVAIIRHLRDRGEEFDSRNTAGLAPVHNVFSTDVDSDDPPILETLQALAEVGADITATTGKRNETILHLFAKFQSIKDEDKALQIVRFAVERGVDILARDKYGRTAIDVCEHQFRPNCSYSPQVLSALEKVARELGVDDK